MEGAATAVTAATGALGPVLAKLRALLADGNSILDGRRETSEILSIKSELEAVYPLLMSLPEAEDLGAAPSATSKGWMGEARELFYDMEDAVEDYLLDLERIINVVQGLEFLNLFRDLKMKIKEVKRRCSDRLLELEAPETAVSKSNRGKRETPTAAAVDDDPRASFLHKDASELVGTMNRQKAKVMELLAGDEEGSASQKLRMVWIVGFAAMGKTTLADLVYRAIGEQFQCRAFASPLQVPVPVPVPAPAPWFF